MTDASRSGPIDLRSDTVTRPTDAMRKVMAQAEVGDDVYGEDPSVRALQDAAAGLFGREAALFVSSGVQANLLAMHVWGRPGTEVVVHEDAHLVAFEAGSSALFAGVQWRTLGGDRGRLDADDVAASLRPASFPFTEVSAVAIEQTTNLGGGVYLAVAELQALRDVTLQRGLALYMDGARVFNALVATGEKAATYGALVDGMMFCTSKGLGAPVGSLLIGDADAIEVAHGWRRRHGGAMRQAGVLAAASLYALEHHVDRLAQDHDNARLLAAGLAERHPGCCDPTDVWTNIVYVDTGHVPGSVVIDAARREGVLVGSMGPTLLRLTTHLDVTADGCRRAVDVIAEVL